MTSKKPTPPFGPKGIKEMERGFDDEKEQNAAPTKRLLFGTWGSPEQQKPSNLQSQNVNRRKRGD